jgi:glycosyltransferase involved in cell wall biosynthesis
MGHIILYIHDFRSSGVVRNALSQARGLAERHRVTLVAGYGQGHFREEAIGAPFETVALAGRPGPFARTMAVLRLRRWLTAQPADLLFSAGNMGHPTVYGATRGLAVRRIYRISSAIARGGGWRDRLRRIGMAMLVRDATRIVLVGAAHRGTPPFVRPLMQGRAVEIANGVDREAAWRLAAAPCPHPWLEEPVPTVVAIGRLRPQKNLARLIEAVAHARQTRRLRLILIGGGAEEERARLLALAGIAKLGADLLMAGETDNVFAWLARASAFALPSLWEGSSMALLEALAVGVPIVAARQAGDAARVLYGGRHGLLVDGCDPVAIGEALLVQVSGQAVRPGDRADAYEPSVDAYVRLVDEALAS